MKQRKIEIVTRDSLIQMLNDASEEKRQQIVGRALVAIFNKQTFSEKSSNLTNHDNMLGFSSADAKTGSLTAKFFLAHKRLDQWQMDLWLRDFRGHPRITKYARQLNLIAIENRLIDLQHKSRITNSEDELKRINQDIQILTDYLKAKM